VATSGSVVVEKPIDIERYHQLECLPASLLLLLLPAGGDIWQCGG
jgi:hypothetical protein